jgi:hypothetical protein
MADTGESSGDPNREHLKGWKEIADFLRVHPRTVQRWIGRGIGVPVHRIDTARSSIVFGTRRELEAWMCSAEAHAARQAEEPATHSTGTDVQSDATLGTEKNREAAERRVAAAVPLGAPDVNAAGTQEPPAGGDALQPAIGGWRRRRRTVRWILWGALGTAATVLALFFSAPIPGRAPVPPRASPAGLARARTIGLVLTFADGATARVGVSVGRPVTIVVAGQAVSLSVEETKSGALLRLYLATQGDATHQPPVLAAVTLTRGQKVSLPPSSGIIAIAWAPADQKRAGAM